ncbi:choice-of-anchor D domain-containing protein [Truepera radiovictrix]|uniref:SbsA Ig-like domain-containing protein n=1 Tax=Truepera radiovictrix (strain DSM 17093 / CIP 108686 / LMG 22925 / RQ-24) TaxID=649638 RepID=D7CVS0_TRURR|nr:choice-of-anchor D domain-containing protein [Truepera radiovictrix]ADI15981.1 hypothetical protein Trad_2883 [Truepera radiovictrix DSM 17093]WMT58393.1 choice-of-anchor D domain-containing protein [Truepera radiovictrix]
MQRTRVALLAGLVFTLSACNLFPTPATPRVSSVSPADGATNVPTNAAVRAQLSVPDSAGSIDLTTLSAETVSLTDVGSGNAVAATRTLEGATLVLRPTEALAPETTYRFAVTEGLATETGATFTPFQSTFTTGQGASPNPDVTFQAVPARVLFTAGGETASDTRTVTLRNDGSSPISLSDVSITGEGAARFDLETPAPATLAPGESATLSLRFTPSAPGPQRATLVVASSDPQTPRLEVPLGGLGVRGQGGNQEPSLQWILDTYGFDIDTGDATPGDTFLVTEPNNDLLGDEVSLQRMVRANPAEPVTIEVLAAFGVPNDPVLEFGVYEAGRVGTREALFTVPQAPALNAQRLAPDIESDLVDASGLIRFDPSSEPFGFYSFWPTNRFFNQRYVYTEDRLNTFQGAVPRQVRAYPLVENGETVENAFVLATEEFSQGFDYNDVVVLVRNVAPASTADIDGLQVTNPLGLPFDDRLVLHSIRDTSGNLCNPERDPTCDPTAQPWLELNTRNTGTVRLRNTGGAPLQVSVSTTEPSAFIFPNGETFLTLDPGSTYDLTVQFAPVGLGGKGVLQAAFVAQVGGATAEMELAGIYMPAPEGGREVYLEGLVVDAFGYPIDVGADSQGGLTSAAPDAPLAGDEVRSAYWRAATPGPVTVTQIAAFHSCCNVTYPFEMFYEGASTPFASFRHERLDGQTIYPRALGGEEIAGMSVSPTGPFEMRSAGYSTNPSLGRGNGNLGLRLWPAKDRSGQPIPNTYIAAQDFVENGCGTTDTANCDYNDNMYLIENIEPVN